MHGITSGVSIAALGDANPEKKAAYIRKHMKDGYDRVAFIDDSPKNVQAVKALRAEFPDAKILVHQAKEHPAPDTPSPTPSTPTASKPAAEDDSEIAKQAQQMGLDYLGFGRYGKNKKVTHTSQNGRLVPKQNS
jgi:hypothetical protein